jgi:hypothetical protein
MALSSGKRMPANPRMEPTRDGSRAARRDRYTDRARKTSDRFYPGRLRHFILARGAVLPRGAGQIAPLGVFGHFDLSRGHEEEQRASGCCRLSGSFGSRRVRPRGNWLSRTATRRRSHMANAWSSIRSTSWAARTSSLVSTVVPGCIILGFRSRSPSRRFPGGSQGHRTRGRFVWRGLNGGAV